MNNNLNIGSSPLTDNVDIEKSTCMRCGKIKDGKRIIIVVAETSSFESTMSSNGYQRITTSQYTFNEIDRVSGWFCSSCHKRLFYQSLLGLRNCPSTIFLKIIIAAFLSLGFFALKSVKDDSGFIVIIIGLFTFLIAGMIFLVTNAWKNASAFMLQEKYYLSHREILGSSNRKFSMYGGEYGQKRGDINLFVENGWNELRKKMAGERGPVYTMSTKASRVWLVVLAAMTAALLMLRLLHSLANAELLRISDEIAKNQKILSMEQVHLSWLAKLYLTYFHAIHAAMFWCPFALCLTALVVTILAKSNAGCLLTLVQAVVLIVVPFFVGMDQTGFYELESRIQNNCLEMEHLRYLMPPVRPVQERAPMDKKPAPSLEPKRRVAHP